MFGKLLNILKDNRKINLLIYQLIIKLNQIIKIMIERKYIRYKKMIRRIINNLIKKTSIKKKLN